MKEKEGIELFFAFFILILLIGTGTFSYMALEGWNSIDAFYFSVSTLTTVGLGDLTPTTQESRLFTSFYILVGIALIFYAFSIIASTFLKRTQVVVDHEMMHFFHKLKNNHEKTEKKEFKPPKRHF